MTDAPMTAERLEAIEARAAAATSDTLAQSVFCASAFSAPNATVLQDVANAVADWRKIARTDVPALLAEVRRLQKCVIAEEYIAQEWRKDHDRACDRAEIAREAGAIEEREACARVCDDAAAEAARAGEQHPEMEALFHEIAVALAAAARRIRARGDKDSAGPTATEVCAGCGKPGCTSCPAGTLVPVTDSDPDKTEGSPAEANGSDERATGQTRKDAPPASATELLVRDWQSECYLHQHAVVDMRNAIREAIRQLSFDAPCARDVRAYLEGVLR